MFRRRRPLRLSGIDFRSPADAEGLKRAMAEKAHRDAAEWISTAWRARTRQAGDPSARLPDDDFS